ncbi:MULTISPECIES: hypothetical protein [Serratia]|uniref:hypothetical protein n=1 Tax=Serratia TaxID=613 RepID=UPI0018D6284F|nr:MULTISPECIES: hypothetical protein [Serratia]MBH2664922.1 hypothetical protein [Serratia ureilytica]MBH3008100.1 hypothetical protein [Serratia ureilytica]MBN5282930.1 hypothetical protein [Serratia ureilytica]MBN5370639.1 hypothetical protein [Serratia ureilytica]MDK7595900.1 hypothetical protein [Serratia ureilytica]
MKTVSYSFFYRYRYLMLALLAMVGCAVSAYALWVKPQIPECRAVVWVADQMGGEAMRRALLISVVPNGARRANVIINGSFFVGDARYNIDRVVMANYRRKGDNYTLTIAANIKRPQDSLASPELNRRLPMAGLQYHLRIERIDSRHFLFVSNAKPLFVCTVAS